jgi:membrane-bound ClpP family serine protease
MVKWLCRFALALVTMLTALSSPSGAEPPLGQSLLQAEAERHVQVLTVRGVINPLTAGYLNRALKRAEQRGPRPWCCNWTPRAGWRGPCGR